MWWRVQIRLLRNWAWKFVLGGDTAAGQATRPAQTMVYIHLAPPPRRYFIPEYLHRMSRRERVAGTASSVYRRATQRAMVEDIGGHPICVPPRINRHCHRRGIARTQIRVLLRKLLEELPSAPASAVGAAK